MASPAVGQCRPALGNKQVRADDHVRARPLRGRARTDNLSTRSAVPDWGRQLARLR
jgi:hypothetical protein